VVGEFYDSFIRGEDGDIDVNDAIGRADEVAVIHGGWLLTKTEDGRVSFAVLELEKGESTNCDGVIVAGPTARIIIRGVGYIGLRELRHTWWGDDDAYIFYPNGKVIAAAFVALGKWFDCD
jgi:hypothetical protein